VRLAKQPGLGKWPEPLWKSYLLPSDRATARPLTSPPAGSSDLDLSGRAGAQAPSKPGTALLAASIGLVAIGTGLLGLGFARHARPVVLVSLLSIGSAIIALALGHGQSGLKGGSSAKPMPAHPTMGPFVRSHPGISRTATFANTSASDTGPLPSAWPDAGIAAPQRTGEPGCPNGAFTYYAPGDDIWERGDQTKCSRGPITRNGSIVAQVTPLTAPDPWAKPQIFKQSAAAADAFAVIAVTPANGVKVQYGSNNRYPAWDLQFPDRLAEADPGQLQVRSACLDLRVTGTEAERRPMR
jgi:hypothetical protein